LVVSQGPREARAPQSGNSFASAPRLLYDVAKGCSGSGPSESSGPPAAGADTPPVLPKPATAICLSQWSPGGQGLVGRSISAATVRRVVAVPRYRWRPPAPAARRLLIRGRSAASVR
jgi:hypothetical protein